MSSPATTELRVSGMTCNNCARHVTEAIQGVANVHSAMVSLEQKRATVQWNGSGPGSVPAVIEAITKAGYGAAEIAPAEDAGGHAVPNRWQWNLIIGLGVTGVLMIGEWVFDLALTPWFQWLAFALAGVVQVFCGAQFYSGAWRQLKVGQSNMDTLVALGSTTAFAYSAWALLAGLGGHVFFMEAAAIISLVSFGHWIEARVGEKASGALKSLLNLAPQTARKLASAEPGEHSTFNPSSVAVLRRVDIQHSTSKGGSVGNPMKMGPANLKTLSFSQSAIETEVPVSELTVHDRVALRPGDRVPVDGVVFEGESAVDEAMLTGEANPVDKKSGSDLFAGTVNLNGRLVMRVTATGAETALAHIVAAVQRAQTSRADIQRLGDRVSNVFVPVIVTVALAAGLWWGLAPESARHVHEYLAQFFWHVHPPSGMAAGFIIAAAVLIIACPCAMGLATPAAIMAAANAAARRGILIRDGVALEKAGGITAVVFDKTGTLTEGKPVVAEMWQSGTGVSPARILAAALARNSTHPISRAVAAYCEKAAGDLPGAHVTVDDWREIRGSGIEANIQQPDPGLANASASPRPLGGEGQGEGATALPKQSSVPSTSSVEHPAGKVRLGSLRWLGESGVDLAPGEKFAAEWSAQGATIVGLAQGTTLLALFAIRDAVKSHSAQVVARLQQQNLKTFLLTGDNATTAAAIGKQAGIVVENIFAGVRPEEKAEFIKKLQAKGERVAFVGDGINDAPALTQADLGIAVSRASDIAREAADIILLKSEIEAVPEALALARQTLRIIKQNLFWAFFYNALGVPLAALGFVSPIFCAAAMGFSDLIVIGNALRLLRHGKAKA